jgi:hypothetical protein
MKILNYKQLCKEPADTMFATLNKMNELSEVFIVGEYPDGRKFLYSPLADVSKMGMNEIEFDSNCFNRRDGTFVVFTKEEVEAYVSKLMGLLAPQVQTFIDTVAEAVVEDAAVSTCVAPA